MTVGSLSFDGSSSNIDPSRHLPASARFRQHTNRPPRERNDAIVSRAGREALVLDSVGN
jgi:hypothetical protein